MRIIVPTELKRKLARNKVALKSFMRASKRVKEDLVDYVISGKTRASRICRAEKAVEVLSGAQYASLSAC